MFVELRLSLPSEDLSRCALIAASTAAISSARQVGALGKVLAQEAVCVLVGAALRGAVGSASKAGMLVSTLNGLAPQKHWVSRRISG